MISIQRDGAVAVIAIDRHEKRNSLTSEVCKAITAGFNELRPEVEDLDNPLRVVVFTGNGTAFSAGADLSGGAYADTFHRDLTEIFETVLDFPAPVIAAVNGPAVGAGVQLALCSDLRMVAPEGGFAIPVAKLGLALDRWTIKRMRSLVGGTRARSVLMAGDILDAQTAYDIGLANRVGSLDDAIAWAHQLALMAPLTLKHLKVVFNEDDAGRPQAEQPPEFHDCWESQDAAEARAARAEKRQPVFKGK